jgi:hypothetical protein
VTTRLATETIRRFTDDGSELQSEETREGVGFAGLERAFEPGWQVALGTLGRAWREPGRELSTVGGNLRILKTSRSRGQVLEAELFWGGAYRRASLDGDAVLTTGGLRVRPRLRLGWGDRLPLQTTFPLGGDDGFPGLHLGERRGDREALVSVLATYQIKGPFVGRLELAAGRSGSGGPLLNSEGWLAGARLGVGAETPVGPVRFEYGVASGGRGSVFVRLGRWF